GQSFDVLDWTSQSGTFSSLLLPSLTGGMQWNTSQLYTTGTVSVGLPGDFNSDGAVDARDFVVWRKNSGGVYIGRDYDVWRASFGGAAGSGAAIASVPEPGFLLLSFVAAYLWPLKRGRRQS